MKVRLLSTVAAVLALGAATAIAVEVLGTGPVCACVPREPDLTPAALDTAEAFRQHVTADNLLGAWAMLTPAARDRYGDISGFRPIVAGLRPGYGSSGGWAAANQWFSSSQPSEMAVARFTTSPLVVVSALVVHLNTGVTPYPLVDPEPVIVTAPALPGAPHGVRARLPDVGKVWGRVAVVGADGSTRLSAGIRVEASVSAASPGPSPSPSVGSAVYEADSEPGQVMAIFAHRTADEWHISVVLTTAVR